MRQNFQISLHSSTFLFLFFILSTFPSSPPRPNPFCDSDFPFMFPPPSLPPCPPLSPSFCFYCELLTNLSFTYFPRYLKNTVDGKRRCYYNKFFFLYSHFENFSAPHRCTLHRAVPRKKKSGGAVSVHKAIGSNLKRLRVAVSVKKICLQCQNFRITLSTNYSKNLGKNSSKIFSLKIDRFV